jgi:hypothetical protein
MSLYREAGGGGRQGLIAGAVALVIGLGAGYLLGNANTDEPSFEDAVAALRTDLAPVPNGLELLGGEYPQGVRGGEIVAQTEYDGSVSNVQRIADTLAAHSTELDQLDPEAAGELTDTIGELQDAIDSQASPAEVDRLRRQAISEFEAILPAPSD